MGLRYLGEWINEAKEDINTGDEILSNYESFDDDYLTYCHLFNL